MTSQTLNTRIPPLLLLLISGFLMWLLQAAAPQIWLPEAFNITVLGIKFGLFIAGALLALFGVIEFRKAQTTVDPRQPNRSASLVSSGVYRLSRNPMYLGFVLWLIAWACQLEHVFSLIIVAAFIAFMNRFQIAVEEQVLAQLFAEDFERYRKKVPRWIRLPLMNQ